MKANQIGELFRWGEALRSCRERRHLKQTQIAQRLGVSPATISRFEQSPTTVDLLIRYLDAVGADLVELHAVLGGAAPQEEDLRAQMERVERRLDRLEGDRLDRAARALSRSRMLDTIDSLQSLPSHGSLAELLEQLRQKKSIANESKAISDTQD